MTEPRKRITDAKLKRAAAIAKSEGVSVRITSAGDFVIAPANANGPEDEDARRVQDKLDAMGRR